MTTPFDFLNSILYNKKDLIKQDVDNEKEYTPWLINNGMSYHIDTILTSNFLNTYPNLPKYIQYKFALAAVRPKKRKFVKWAKKVNNSDLDLICESYSCNKRNALKYLDILNEEQKQLLKQQQERGGI